MPLAIQSMNCCACRQISNLHQFPGPDGAKTAMLELCEEAFHRNRLVQRKWSDPYSFYIFNGVVEYKKGSWELNAANLSFYPTNYVQSFKQLILDAGLGDVGDTPPEWNRVNNPTHLIMNCVWKPDVKALKKWYRKNRPKPKRKK